VGPWLDFGERKGMENGRGRERRERKGRGEKEGKGGNCEEREGDRSMGKEEKGKGRMKRGMKKRILCSCDVENPEQL